MPFQCSICGEESTRICARCTKDACDNHVCEKCLKCSDCCECEVKLSPRASESVRAALHIEVAPRPEAELQPEAPLEAEPEPRPEPAAEAVVEPSSPAPNPEVAGPLFPWDLP
jgi:hypothetical protein